MTGKKITDKHKQFCRELLKNKFNQTDAYQKTYPKVSNATARANSYKLLTKTHIQEYLDKIKLTQENKELVTIEEIVNGIKKVLTHCITEDETGGIKEQGALKALELLGKYKSMFTDNVNHSGETRNVMTFEKATQTKE